MTARTYRTSSEALEVAELLDEFGLHPTVTIVAYETDMGEITGWEVAIASVSGEQSRSTPVARIPDPLDLDEVVDYIDSHWDRELDDREIQARRGRRDF